VTASADHIWLPEGCVVTRSTAGCSSTARWWLSVGVNLADALVFCLGILPVLDLTLAVLGAALGAQTTHRAVPNDPSFVLRPKFAPWLGMHEDHDLRLVW
jgi:hypothetical protein